MQQRGAWIPTVYRWLCTLVMVCAAHHAGAQALPLEASTTNGTATSQACTPQLLGAWAAQETQPEQRPADHWQAITLPDIWQQRWPDWSGPTWYRMDWTLPCPAQHWALSVSGMRTAGRIYWGNELLWSDRHTQPPYSRSANMPRWWPLSTQGRSGVQTVWIRISGENVNMPGLGHVHIGPADVVRDRTEVRQFRQRTGYTLAAAMSAAVGCMAFFIWLWRRSERAYLWFGLMQLMWMAYLTLLLQSEPLLGMAFTVQSKAQLLAFLLHAQCFGMFSLRFMGLRFPKIEALTWLAVLAWTTALAMDVGLGRPMLPVWLFRWGALLVHASCVMVIVQALRTRQAPHLWLALCWLGILLVAAHDIVVAMRVWDYDQTWSVIFGPVSTLFLACLLGWQLASHMRRVDSFNTELKQHVDAARSELAQVLAQQHTEALQHAKLQERVRLAHDLHDGLGSSLVRSLALVEQAAPQLHKERVLSMLKVLRDDLRQVIDVGAQRHTNVPDTPGLWLAPLRHRFTLILDELDLKASWQVDPHWQQAPSALQCLAMSRFLEEAFANVLKHSRAKNIRLLCTQTDTCVWRVVLEDDGVGFDVGAAQSADSMGVGMHSMQTRLGRVGGRLQVFASAAGCQLVADIQVVAPSAPAADPT